MNIYGAGGRKIHRAKPRMQRQKHKCCCLLFSHYLNHVNATPHMISCKDNYFILRLFSICHLVCWVLRCALQVFIQFMNGFAPKSLFPLETWPIDRLEKVYKIVAMCDTLPVSLHQYTISQV